ncbi:hypothetical protein BWI75_25060 [Gloeocapsopsis sp. AAB1 = 1H9]|uniref:Uncharacterized protein n=2 Tax=Gloeocapsopsis TaxID=693222 RepID=A0A6N8G222_9CHRO|nr:hypothetical protein [Gloeocapsopsis dulcis AAB1 = 1H9]
MCKSFGSLTEYFKFIPDDAQSAQRDLDEMEAKVLSPVEQENIDGTQDDFLTALLADKQNIRVSNSMETELKQYFLSRPSSQAALEALHQGHFLRHAAQIASIPVDTARKVLAMLQKE